MTGVLVKRGNLDTAQKEVHVKTQGESSHLQTKVEASEEGQPADT